MPNRDHEVIVVGLGGMGSAATAHLADRGIDVLGLERYNIPNTMGSSHGITRIIRKAYHEHPSYVPLLERAYELWRRLDADHDRDLLHIHGSLAAGRPESEVLVGARTACERHNLSHEVLDAGEVTTQFPGYDLPMGYQAVFQPDGGFLWSEQCIVAHVEMAHEQGATIRARERVIDWRTTPTGVHVETTDGSYTAEQLVIAGGAWAPKLLPRFEGILSPERQVLGWFQPTAPARFTPPRFPVFIIDEGEDNLFYGFPRFHVPGVKVGKHYHFNEAVNPDEMAREPRGADEQVLRDFLNGNMPTAAGQTMALSTCLYTNTPDKAFVIDRHPWHEEVLVACGFSGHGFKFASVIGEVLADLAVDGRTDHPIDRFAADRFWE